MKKLILLFFVLLGLGGSYFFHNNFSRAFNSIPTYPIVKAEASPTITPIPEIVPSVPLTISIPSLEVEASVERVGKDSEGRMDIPKQVYNAAWYELGALPGEIGNSVIAAHYDTPSGDPSVFYSLGELSKGDEIIATDEKGTEFVFEVTDVKTYDNANFPLKEVFGKHNKKRLNLITCAGVFDRTKQDYLDRTVVYSELKSVSIAQLVR